MWIKLNWDINVKVEERHLCHLNRGWSINAKNDECIIVDTLVTYVNIKWDRVAH